VKLSRSEGEVKMKQTVFMLLTVVALLAWTLPVALAGQAADDPKLCVEGKWLVVVAAPPSAVKVFVPEDTHYGNQQQGGCRTPGPNVPPITAVVERGEHHVMSVQVDGKFASRPTVKATYGDAVRVQPNDGRGNVNFLFFVR
jgi:hypothetical protein